MLKLAAAPNCKVIGEKLGYEEYDWIEREKINVYQELVDLPSYSPNLNKIEKLLGWLKGFRNK